MQHSARPGRNDACPCGSGRKYKKCHLPSDEAEAGEALRKAAEAREAQAQADRRWEDFGEDFEAAGFPEKVSQLRNLLTGVEQPEEDVVLSYFDELWDAAESAAEREAFGDLADLLAARHPEAFDVIGGYLLECRIHGAILDGRLETLGPLFLAFARCAADDLENLLENLMAVSSRLAYLGLLDVLVQGYRECWSRLRENGGSEEPGAEAIARRGATYALFAALGDRLPGAGHQEKILEQVRFFEAWDTSMVATWIGLLDAGPDRWRREDFAVGRGDWKDDPDLRAQAQDALAALFHAFIGYLHRDAGYSWPRADLASAALHQLLEDRMEGRVKGQPRRKGAPDLWQDKSIRLLCPSPEILEQHIASLYDAAAVDESRALALCEGLPHWFAFLDRMGLVAESESRPIQDVLEPVAKRVSDAIIP